MGNKIITFNQQGQILSDIDDRDLAEEKIKKCDELKKKTSKKILAKVPEYKQRNIGLGLIDGDVKTDLLSKINDIRSRCDVLENMVLECKSLAELDTLYVVGTNFTNLLKDL